MDPSSSQKSFNAIETHSPDRFKTQLETRLKQGLPCTFMEGGKWKGYNKLNIRAFW